MKIEKKIKQLETMVQDLEAENPDLDTACEKYTDAFKIAKEVLVFLKETESKVKILEKDNAKILAGKL